MGVVALVADAAREPGVEVTVEVPQPLPEQATESDVTSKNVYREALLMSFTHVE